MIPPLHSRFPTWSAGLLAAALIAAGFAAPAPTASSKAVAQSRHIRETVDALFKHRLKPEPLPIVLPNPFVVVSGGLNKKSADGAESDAAEGDPEATAAAPAAKPAGEPPAGSDSEMLARHIAALKIGGVIQINGQLQLIINQIPRKEGDLIFLDNKSALTYLRIIRITPYELTLGLNEAEQTVRLKN